MSEFLKRSLTGLLFVIVIIGSVYLHPIAFVLVFLFFTAGGLIEFYKLTSGGKINTHHIAGIIAGTGLYLSVFSLFFLPGNRIALFALIILLLIPLSGLFVKGPGSRDIVSLYLGILYVSVPFSLLFFLLFPIHLSGIHTPSILIGFFSLLWSYDTGAYITGKPFGKHKIATAISPGKSWEGFFGGIIIAGGICYLISLYFIELTLIDWSSILIIIVIMGTLGDMFESVLKRNAGIKDSGNILPGHGGILDRFDSVLLSVPVIVSYYLIKYLLL